MTLPKSATPPAAGTPRPDVNAIVAEISRRAAATDPSASFCPSDVARSMAGPHPEQWGPLMQPIRRVATDLARAGRLVIYRKGRPVDPSDFKGVYRLGAPRQD